MMPNDAHSSNDEIVSALKDINQTLIQLLAAVKNPPQSVQQPSAPKKEAEPVPDFEPGTTFGDIFGNLEFTK